jgi:hypothetical protein
MGELYSGVNIVGMVKETIEVFPTECLVQLLTLVLKHNNFTFNGEHFLQINGTAMGTKMAPSYANIFMGKLEKLIIQSALHKRTEYFWCNV